jgi:ribosomal-protein-alanine N-acetyltransferase
VTVVVAGIGTEVAGVAATPPGLVDTAACGSVTVVAAGVPRLPEARDGVQRRQAALRVAARTRLSSRPDRSWGSRQVAEELVRPMARVLVAASGSNEAESPQLLGVAVAWRVAGDAQVMELAVRPAWRRRGLGGALLDAVCSAASDEHGVCLRELRESNAGAALLYERHGFVRVGLRRKYYPDGEAAVLMTRPAGAAARKSQQDSESDWES